MTSVLFESIYHLPYDGWCIATRAYTRAMKLSGIQLQLHSWAPLPLQLDDVVLSEVGDCLGRLSQLRDVYVFSTALGGPQQMKHSLTTLLTQYFAPRVLYTMFERTTVQPEITAATNMIEGVWVPCSANAEVMKRCGSVNTTYIPYPYFDDDPALKLAPPSGSRTFLWIGRWEPRKAPDLLLKAFLCAFKPGESHLIMKLGPVPWEKPYVVPESCLKQLLDLPAIRQQGWTLEAAEQDIEFIRGKLTPDEILALHARSDIYVSASRGEGIDLPAFTAKLAGRRIVTTDSGGPRDFVGEGDVLVPTCGTVPAPQYEFLWGPGCTYADYKMTDLIQALQKARGATSKVEPVPVANRAEYVGKKLLQWMGSLNG